MDLEQLIEDTKVSLLRKMEAGRLYAPAQVVKEWGIGFVEFREASEQLAAEGLVKTMPVHKPGPQRTKAYLVLTKKGVRIKNGNG